MVRGGRSVRVGCIILAARVPMQRKIARCSPAWATPAWARRIGYFAYSKRISPSSARNLAGRAHKLPRAAATLVRPGEATVNLLYHRVPIRCSRRDAAT